MDDRLSIQEVQAKYLHISKHTLPFETKIVNVIPQDGINFSDRWKFLKGLFYIVEDGYYFQYDDVCSGTIKIDQEGQPFDLFLDGALRCAYSYSFCSSISETTAFLISIITEGFLCISKNQYDNLIFTFVNYGYTYLPTKDGNNIISNYTKTIKNKKEINTTDLLSLVVNQYEDFSKAGNFYCVKERNEHPHIYETNTLKPLDVSFDKIVYGNYYTEYTESSVFESGYDDYFICKKGKWGCLDGEGNIKIDCLYDRIEHFGSYIEDGYIVSQYNCKGLISDNGAVIIPCLFDKIECLTDKRYNSITLYLTRRLRKLSIWDETGKCLKSNLDECCFVNSYSEGDDYETYRRWDVFWMKANGIGSIVRGSKFDRISDVAYNKYKGCINYLGEIFIIVAKSNRYGIIDAKGKVIIDFIYEDLSFIDDMILLAYKEGKCGVIGFKKKIIPIMYDDLVPVVTTSGRVNSYIGVLDGNIILLDINGNALFTNCNYDKVYVEDVYDKAKGFIIIGCSVMCEEKWGFVKQDGYPLIPCIYEEINPLISNNTIIAFKVKLYGLYGVVDVNNRFLIECQCSELYHFRTDLHNIYVYKRSDRSTYFAFIESEIELKSKQYWQIDNELINKGFGKRILD